MEYSANGNPILPNTFQHPNIFVDKLMYFLTSEENVVLTFAVRRILGFVGHIAIRKDHIALSQFTDGIFSQKDGSQLSQGCGLSLNAVRRALKGLEKHRILIPTTDRPDPRRGQEYWLQENTDEIDWVGLKRRKEERLKIQRNRTQKATKASLESRGFEVETGEKVGVTSTLGVTSTPPLGVTSDVRLGVTSDVNTKPKETQENPHTQGVHLERATEQSLTEETKKEIQQEGNWKFRDQFPKNHLPLVDKCAAIFGAPIKRDVMVWIREIGDWLARDVTPEDFDDAMKLTKKWSNPPVSPMALTRTIIKVAQDRKVKGAQDRTKVRLIYKDGKPVWVSA